MEGAVLPLSASEIFGSIAQKSPENVFAMRVSYLQVYNETIQDLLRPEKTNLAVREDKKRGVFVEGLSEWNVRGSEDLLGEYSHQVSRF